MTHAECQKRNHAIVKAARAGATYAALCDQFAATYHVMGAACREHGVRPSTRLDKRDAFWRVLADLFNSPDTLTAIGVRHQMSRERVRQLCEKCREFGLPLKCSRAKGATK